MKRKSILTLLFVMLAAVTSWSQNKLFTIEEAVAGQWRELYPKHMSGIQAYDENDFSYVKDYKQILRINSAGGAEILIADLEQINQALINSGANKMNYFPYWDYSWKTPQILTFTTNNLTCDYDISAKKIISKIEIPAEAENVIKCKSKSYIAYTIKNNLYFADNKGFTYEITKDENEGIVNGNGYTHRQEFGIAEGSFWSPAGNYIAFYRKDETMVADYPLVDISTPIAKLKNTKYPMAGQKSEEVKLGIYDINKKKTVFADVTDFTAERYLTSISWSPDEQFVYIGVLNREQNHLKFNKYQASTGKFIKTLFEEKNEKYVEPENPVYFVKNQPDKFIYLSEKDGYKHMYLMNTEGNQISQITSGNWVVTSFAGFDKTGQNIYFEATKDSPLEIKLYSVNIKSGKITNLSPEAGTHSCTVSNSDKYVFDQYSSFSVPNIAQINTADGKTSKILMKAENPLTEYKMGNAKTGTIKAADGKTDLYYQLITPPDFDPNKKYPAIVYVYGGPHAQMITNSWAEGGLWNYYMAQKGYVMFTIDNRGSENRGFDFESVIHRHCGVEEAKDQMKGVEFLKSLNYVDQSRIGVHGWSYGGFMTTTLMTDYGENFKAGVAGGPVIDWKYYEVMYGERYMDTPQENPDGYNNTSLLNKAGKLKGRLLVIHGYIDPVVVPQNSLDFIRSVIEAETDIDYFFYPECEHNMRGKNRIHLMKKVTRYFDDYLYPENK